MSVLFSLLLVIFNNSPAQTEISGFFDVYNSFEFQQKKYSGFQINQFEIDISHVYKGHLSLGTAIAYNGEQNNLELSMAYLHYNFIKGEAMHPHREEQTAHSGIVVGKFDVSFGLDHLSYASPDRPVISQPVVIEKTIGVWNDSGLNFHVKRNNFYIDFCAVNGFNKGLSLGGSIQKNFFNLLQLGFSHASDFASIKKRNSWINGFDLMAETKNWEVKSEYIWTKGLLDGAQDTLLAGGINSGFYVQVLTQLQDFLRLPFFITVRYGFWNSNNDYDNNGEKDGWERYTFGSGYQFNNHCSARMEIRRDRVQENRTKCTASAQLVVAF